MPRLYLLRHGIAEADGDDPALSHDGALRLERQVRWMERLGISFDLILASPLRRARQTARIVGEGLRVPGAVHVCEEAGPGCTLAGITKALARQGGTPPSVLVVGHQPDMGRLASLLTGARVPVPFSRGTLACLESASWPPEPPCALLFLLPAEALGG